MKASAVKPYLSTYAMHLRDAFEQRYEMLLRLSAIIFVIIAISTLWYTLANQGHTSFGGYQISELVAYVVIAVLIRRIISGFPVAQAVESDITDATFTANLCRPIEHWKYRLAIQCAQISITLPIIIIGLLAIFWWTGLSSHTTIIQVLIASTLIILGFLFSFFEFYTVGILAFWIERVWGIRYTLDYVENFIAGTLIPLTVFPPAFQTVSYYFPFSHMIYSPTALLMGKISVSEGIMAIGILLVWTIMLFLFSQWLWKKGLAKYDGKM